jgi:hypothetical protein
MIESLLIIIGGVVAILGIGAITGTLGAVIRGFVLSKLWLWFMVPVFHLPVLGIVAAIGISLVIGFLTADSSPTVCEDKRSTGEKFGAILGVLFSPFLVLLVGYIVHLFM